ncbi:hypothetical protein [Paenibacillus xylanexedens]|uniref:hypothetical protein n=1 Tax=Paenibacillus xylanexedens TaxID=528191 RepID=UPI001C92DDB6|nr:hypothetical protein [Paenibacillus xylanexedens]
MPLIDNYLLDNYLIDGPQVKKDVTTRNINFSNQVTSSMTSGEYSKLVLQVAAGLTLNSFISIYPISSGARINYTPISSSGYLRMSLKDKNGVIWPLTPGGNSPSGGESIMSMLITPTGSNVTSMRNNSNVNSTGVNTPWGTDYYAKPSNFDTSSEVELWLEFFSNSATNYGYLTWANFNIAYS